MGDMGDFWRDVNAASREKRADNREFSASVLRGIGVPFLERNGGAHLIVGSPPVADFWPGTGKWLLRGSNDGGRGVKSLIKWMKSNGLLPVGGGEKRGGES